MSAPTCCGRPMHRDGIQWVCGRCGSWTDPGTTAPDRLMRAFLGLAATWPVLYLAAYLVGQRCA